VHAAQAKLNDPSLDPAVDDKLRAVIAGLGVQTWFVPLGLWHGDHKLTARACLRVAQQMPQLRWVVYEELPYRLEVPLEIASAKEHIGTSGFAIRDAVFASSPNSSQKREMVSCYRSQLPCLGARVEVALAAAEVFYLLVPT
jgi:LmbE family N-acetylglucosaminyl deacetylase